MLASSITPPLRRSRRDKGAARSRSGGGQTRRPVREIADYNPRETPPSRARLTTSASIRMKRG